MWTGSANVTTSGNLTVSGSTVTLGGTCAITGALSRTSGSLTLSSGTTTVTGGVSGMFTHNSGTVILSDTQTVNTGSSFNNLTLGGAEGKTLTLSADCTVTGTFTCSYDWTSNGNNLYWQGNITGASGKEIGGTTNITINGGANQTWTGNGGQVRNNLTINKSGNTLSLVGTIVYTDGIFTYTAGTVDALTGASTLQVNFEAAHNCTLSTDGIDFYNLTFKGSGTTTLSNDLSVDGTLTCTTWGIIDGANINASGSFVSSADQVTGSTTGKIVLDGTGTWSGGGRVRMDLDIDTSGTISLSGTIRTRDRVLRYVSGTVNAGTSTLDTATNTSLDLDGIVLNNVSVGSTTLLSDLRLSGLLTSSNGNVTGSAYTIYSSGGMTPSGYLVGDTTVELTGGTWSGNVAVGLKVNLNGNVTISGTVILQSSVYGNAVLKYISGNITTTGSTIRHTSSYAIYDTNGMSFNNISIESGNMYLASDIDISGTFTIGDGEGGKFYPSGYDVYLSGDWTRNLNSLHEHGNGAVVFDGAGTSVITGTNTFYDLTCITPSKRLEFASGVTQTIAHTLNLNGQAASTRIVLARNGGSGTDRFTFDVATPQTVYYVDVANSNASTSDIFNRMGRDSGNTDRTEATPHWVFSNAKYISVEMGQK
jgi:hypothetical protein